MSQQQPNCRPQDVAEMAHRLKTRLALADFKRKHGYEKYDLLSLEWCLLHTQHRRQHIKSAFTLVSAASSPAAAGKASRSSSGRSGSGAAGTTTARRFYYHGHSHHQPKLGAAAAAAAAVTKKRTALLSRTMTRGTPLYPLSAKRSTSPCPTSIASPPRRCASSSPLSKSHTPTTDLVFSSDEEDAANLLVMLQRQQRA